MARVTVAGLPRATKEYSEPQFNVLIRELEQIITQLNFSYQQDAKDEAVARSWYLG